LTIYKKSFFLIFVGGTTSLTLSLKTKLNQKMQSTNSLASASAIAHSIAPASTVERIKNLLNSATERGASFVGVTYRAKESGELSRYTLAVGVQYLNLVKKSLAEARAVTPTDNAKASLDRKAKADVLRSLRNTLENAKHGEQNDAYTKKGMYAEVASGVNVFDDGTFELKGIVVSRKVLEVGVHKQVKSRPLTIAKDAIRKQLSLSKWRTLCLDSGALDSLRAGHKEIEVA
jgi:hypothetical protein